MKKFITPFLFCFFASTFMFGQGPGVFTHYHINPYLINPAAAGSNPKYHDVFINIRSQWAGFPGSPKSYSLNYNGPLAKQIGVGAMLFSESISFINQFRAQVALNYRVKVEKFDIGIGIGVDYLQEQLNSAVADQPLEFYDLGDQVIEDYIDGVEVVDATLGIYGTFAENTFFGISVPSIIQNRLDEISSADGSSSFFRYYAFLVGQKIPVDEHTAVEASMLLKRIRTSPFQYDANIKGLFLDSKLITGVSYRGGADSGGTVGFLLGTKYKTLQLYYSFDIFLDDFQKFNSGTHEITLNFGIERKKGSFDRSKKYRK